MKAARFILKSVALSLVAVGAVCMAVAFVFLPDLKD